MIHPSCIQKNKESQAVAWSFRAILVVALIPLTVSLGLLDPQANRYHAYLVACLDEFQDHRTDVTTGITVAFFIRV